MADGKTKRRDAGNPLRSEGGVIRVAAEGIMASRARMSRSKISGDVYAEVAKLLEEYRADRGPRSMNSKSSAELGAMHMALGMYLLDNPGALEACPDDLRPYSPQEREDSEE